MFYNIKVYDMGLIYKSTISPKDIKSNIRFTNNINWGQGRLTVELNLPIDDTTFDLWDIIFLYAFSDLDKAGTLVYRWAVQDLQRRGATNYESIVLECVGIATLLTNITTSWNYQPNQDPRQTIIDLIAIFAVSYPWLITSTSIPLYGSNRSFKFSNTPIQQAIQTIVDLCWWYWYVGADWVLVAWPKPVAPDHFLTYKKDVEYIRITETRQTVVNNYEVANASLWLSGTASDVTSQWLYWKIRKYENNSRLNNQAALDDFALNYIAQNKDPKRDIEIKVNQEFDILAIQPWETIKVRNLQYPITNAQIVKTSFDGVSIVLYVERYISVATEIASIANPTD